jgi:O-antigen/teichoic acid export membrane protein
MDNKKVFSGLFWRLGERVCAQGVSFIVSIVLARILLPSDYGAVSLILVFITIADVFVTSGLSAALIQKKESDETDFSTMFYCTLGMSVCLYAILFALSPRIADFYGMKELTVYLRVFSMKLIISAYSSIQHAYVSKHMIFRRFFYSTMIGTVLSGIVGIAMAYAGFGAWAIIAQYLVNSLMDTVILAITVPWHPRLLFSARSAKNMVGYGWKILAAELLGTIFDNLRSLLVGRFYTPAELAYYNKGLQFPQVIGGNIDVAVTSVLFPAMSHENDSTERVKAMARRSMRCLSYVMCPLMFGLAAVAKSLVLLLLTEKWLDSVFIMQVLCISQAVSALSKVNYQAMKALGRSDIMLQLEFVKKPVYFIVLICSLRFGIRGIAIGMLLYSMFGTAINMLPNRKLLDYSFREQISDVAPAVLLSAAMFVLVLPAERLGLPEAVILLLQTVTGAVFYIAASALIKVDAYNYLLGICKSYIGRKHDK